MLFFPPKTQWNFVIEVSDAIRFWEDVLAQVIYNSLKNLVLVTLQRQFLYFLYNCKCPQRTFNSLQSSSLDFIKMNKKPKVKFLLQIKNEEHMVFKKDIWIQMYIFIQMCSDQLRFSISFSCDQNVVRHRG